MYATRLLKNKCPVEHVYSRADGELMTYITNVHGKRDMIPMIPKIQTCANLLKKHDIHSEIQNDKYQSTRCHILFQSKSIAIRF